MRGFHRSNRIRTTILTAMMMAGLGVGPVWAQTATPKSLGWARFWGIGSTVLIGGTGTGLAAVGVAADSAGARSMGTVLGAAGLGIGPGTGHIYCEEFEHAFLTSMGRLLFLGAAAAGVSDAVKEERSPNSGETLVGFFGAVGWMSLTIYDFFDIDDAVRRYSEGAPTGSERRYMMQVFPVVGRSLYGTGLAVRF